MGRDVRSRTLVRPAFKTLRITVRIGTVGRSHECCEAHVDNDVVSGVRLRTVVADGLTVGWGCGTGRVSVCGSFWDGAYLRGQPGVICRVSFDRQRTHSSR